jgi:hypothetical protein
MSENRFCASCKHMFKDAGLYWCGRKTKYDPVTGGRLTGTSALCEYERSYAHRNDITRCGPAGVFFVRRESAWVKS